MRRAITYFSSLILFLMTATDMFAQPGSSIELDKPQKYENRTLGSEKTGQKKFSFTKRLFQNNFTHYNYYFNANTRLNDIIEQAKLSSKEDYTRLLPFYNYSLDVTSQSGDLDSVIYKCNAGILLHDLRNNWVDNMYLLLGEAYFFRKNFDSAEEVFRYINYAFAPKEEGGYDIPVGSNISNTNGQFSVSTKEKNSFPKSLVTMPPSRNDALLWQARNYTESDRFGEAAGILEILRSDPNFPERLHSQLNEIAAYWCYKQRMYDSAASYLSKSLDITGSKLEKARRQFLIAQLWELSNNKADAIKWYTKSAETTTDPIMEVYANLNSIRASGDTSKNTVSDSTKSLLQEKLNNLLKMAHRDKYTSYRDIIYYAIAQVELENNNSEAAEQMLHKSIRYNAQENPEQRSKSFLLLANINYEKPDYIAAKNFYDSVDASVITDENEKSLFNDRQAALGIIANGLTIIHQEDSLQTVAAMPKDQRDAYVRKTVRTLRRQMGLKEEDSTNINPAVQQLQQGGPDIFNNNAGVPGANSSSEWYFNNLSLKGAGYNQFRARWGRRPNVDNWQRLAAANAQNEDDNEEGTDSSADLDFNDKLSALNNLINNPGANAGDISFDALYETLPLTPEKLKASNDKIGEALYINGVTFQNKLEDYPAAINAYEQILNKYPDSAHLEEILFNLYYCYNKVGRNSSADSVRNALNKNFANGTWTAKLNNRQAPDTTANVNDAATLKYKEIYNLFLEGKFKEAKNEKAKADSVYGNSYWTPQLLYIEAIYYVSVREDSAAIDRLINLQNLTTDSAFAEKATTMIDVLHRRSEIETYLTNLQIKRYEEDETPVVNLTQVQPTINKVEVTRDSVKSNPVAQQAATKVDTAGKAPAVIRTYEFNPKDQQYVVILLDKVAPVYINEAKNAFTRYNQINFYNQKLNITPVKLDDRYNLVLVGPFEDAVAAVNYVDKTKPQTTSRILPWLTPDKYSYGIISQSNLDIMQETKDVDSYKKLLEKVLPGKF
jgi:outer membrane protein assembly factor BamD (BamD/ComL family)/tetratricopeptide (TPR) repeat protein